MGKLKFTLTHLWFWAILGITVLMCENVPFLYSDNIDTKQFTLTSISLLSILLIVLYFVYFFFEHKKNKMKFDYVLLPILILLFVSMLVGIWSTPSSFEYVQGDYHRVIEISNKEKLISSIETFFCLLFVYIFTFVQGRYGFKRKGLSSFAFWYIPFISIAIIYSVIAEFPKYQRVFSFSLFDGELFPQSFFVNPNIFAFALLIGVMDLVAIKTVKHYWWIYPFMIILLVEAFIVRTATVFFILSIVFTISVIFDLIVLFKKKPIVGAAVLSILLLSVFGFFLFVGLNVGRGNKFVDFIYKQLFEKILDKNYETFSNRLGNWEIAISIAKSDPLCMIFGMGRNIEKNVLTIIAHEQGRNIQSAHNGYLELILKGGIVLLTLYAIAMLYFIFVCIQLIRRGKVRYSLTFLLCFIGLLAHSFVESTHFFGGTVSCVIETWLIFLPPIVYYKQLKHPDFRRATINANAWQNSITVPNMTRMIAYAIFGFLVALIVPFLIFQNNFSIMFKDILVLAIIELAICLLFLPYLFSLWYKRSTTRGFYYTMIIWLLVFFGAAPGLLVLIYNLTGVKDYSLLSYLKVGLPLSSLALMSFALLVSSLTKGGSFIQWIKETFIGAFKLGLVPLAFMLITFFTAMVYIWNQPSVEMLDVLFVTAISLAVYFALFMFIDIKSYRSIKDEINDNRLLYYRRAAIREEMENVR